MTGISMLGSASVASLAGVTIRQLQWWDEQRLISPRHERHRRIYTKAETVEIIAIAELRRKGVPLQKIRQIGRLLRKEVNRFLPSLLAGYTFHLATDGNVLLVDANPAALISGMARASSPMWVVEIGSKAQKVGGVA